MIHEFVRYSEGVAKGSAHRSDVSSFRRSPATGGTLATSSPARAPGSLPELSELRSSPRRAALDAVNLLVRYLGSGPRDEQVDARGLFLADRERQLALAVEDLVED